MKRSLNAPTTGVILALALCAAGSARAQVNDVGYFSAKTGEGLYGSLCQGCHMPDAKGAAGAAAYPALAANKRLASAAYPAILVLQGHKAMPPFAGNLTDDQIAAVVNYVRTHFGNAYKDPISAATVKALRASGAKRSGKATEAG